MRRAIYLLLTLGLCGSAEAQTTPPTVKPGTAVAFEIDPGRMASGTSTVPRPPENLTFQWRIDGATTTVDAVRRGVCAPATGMIEFTCQVIIPTLSEGRHTLRLSARPNPAESGVSPGGDSDALEVTVIIVLSPSAPRNLRPAS